MNNTLCSQLSIDFCCSKADVADAKNHFTIHQYLEGRRRFREEAECFLKIAVVNGKVLFSGQEEILEWCRKQYEHTGGEWFFEAANMRRLDEQLHKSGHQIMMVHPFFISESIYPSETGDLEIRWYEEDEIEQFRGDNRFDEAYSFCADAPDVLGVAALRGGTILGMAGASSDSPTMWQIGINVEPAARQSGIGGILVNLLKNEILRRGILPYYGTSMSHIASQRTALRAGFAPAWAELAVSRITEGGGPHDA